MRVKVPKFLKSFKKRPKMPDLKLVKKALLIRRAEEKLLDLYRAGELFGTVHTCIGQEWTGVAVAENLREGDWIVSNHRCHGHFIAKTGNLVKLFAEVMGRSSGACGGIGGSQHLYAEGFMSNGIQGGMMPVSAGMSLAFKLDKNKNIGIIFIGDGTLGEGTVYETLNIISKWSLPLLVLIENNGIAQTTPIQQNLAGSIAGRVAAFGIDYIQTTTNDVDSFLATIKDVSEKVRNWCKPIVVEVMTNRLKAHSKGDDTRLQADIDTYEKKDLLTKLILSGDVSEMLAEIDSEIELAVSEAQSGQFMEKKDLPHSAVTLGEQSKLSWQFVDKNELTVSRYVQLLNQTFEEIYRQNPKAIFMGEDVASPYGGAFKVTKDIGLSDDNQRIYNTPISEASIIGVGAGLALQGFKPIVEIMFGDFLSIGFDQLFNHAAKFEYIYNGQVRVPLIVRTPMGGYRGYGPTHSQSTEKYFLGMPYLNVLALNHFVHPSRIYKPLLEKVDRPTLVVENKLLYARPSSADIPGYSVMQSNELFPTIRISPQHGKPDVTIFCYGWMLDVAEKALSGLFEELDVFAEVICPTALHPFCVDSLVESLKTTRALLTIEEGHSFAALGSEVTALALEKVGGFRLKRIGLDSYIPTSRRLENQILPSVESVIMSIKMLLEGRYES